MAHIWLAISRKDLKIEKAQCEDEGKDLSRFKARFAALDRPKIDDDPRRREEAGRLVDETTLVSPRRRYSFVEPSALREIRKSRGRGPVLKRAAPKGKALLDKAYGGWVGRCCGCLLGKPVEGRRRGEIEAYLKSQGRWPLAFYFSNKADEKVRRETGFPAVDNPCYVENIRCMVEDDDTNYTTVGLAVVDQHGKDFTPANVGDFWLRNIPILHVCTAERTAYRNMVNRVPVPDPEGKYPGRFSSATYRNPYREWIGAQIRADFFGYCCPGKPERAAEFAWRDACISHIKNGIYGEMWVAAMLAAAYMSDDVETVIRAGLGQVPARSRLVRDIEEVLSWWKEGRSYWEAVDAIHRKWNATFSHHWCHTNSNAQIVALALLWGKMDYGKTVCGAVMPGFDTDCNGATAGSVLGVMLGRKALPARWVDPIRDTLLTGVHGYHEVKLEQMAVKTVEIINRLAK